MTNKLVLFLYIYLLYITTTSSVLSAKHRKASTVKKDYQDDKYPKTYIEPGTSGFGLPKETFDSSSCLQPVVEKPMNPTNLYKLGVRYDILTRRCKYHDYYSFENQDRPSNHFHDLSSCENTCIAPHKSKLTCSLLPEPGFRVTNQPECSRQSLFRWYHRDGQCYQFLYTGCGGNLNNFYSRESCLHFCSGKGELNYNKDYDEHFSRLPGDDALERESIGNFAWTYKS